MACLKHFLMFKTSFVMGAHHVVADLKSLVLLTVGVQHGAG